MTGRGALASHRAADAGVRVEIVTDADRFAAVRADWNELASANIFLTWEWLDSWWRFMQEGRELRLLLGWRGPALVAGIALCAGRGSVEAMADVESDYFRPLSREPGDLEPLLDALVAMRPSRVAMTALPAGDPAAERLEQALSRHGWLLHTTFRERCGIVDTRGSFADYSRSLSANARRQITRSRRRLEQQGNLELRPLEPVDDLEAVLEEAFALEAAGWKGRSNKAILSSPRMTRLYTEVFSRFHRNGVLRFSQLRLDGALIAMSIDVVHGRRLFVSKMSYDERYGPFAPGHVLRYAAIERCCDEAGIDSQELMGPMHRWKERFSTDARETYVLRGYRRRSAALARYAARRWVVPRIRPLYINPRRAIDRWRERRAPTDPR